MWKLFDYLSELITCSSVAHSLLQQNTEINFFLKEVLRYYSVQINKREGNN